MRILYNQHNLMTWHCIACWSPISALCTGILLVEFNNHFIAYREGDLSP